jgi:hypothetical protein
MLNPITASYMTYTEKMSKFNCDVIINEPCDVVHIKNYNNQKEIILNGPAGEGFIAEVRRLWHLTKDMPLDVAFTGHAYKQYKSQLI